MPNNNDYTITLGNVKYYINGNKQQKEIIQNALEKFENIFFVLMEADKYNCLIRAEALTNDPVTQDIVKRTNDMCLKHDIYLIPR